VASLDARGNFFRFWGWDLN